MQADGVLSSVPADRGWRWGVLRWLPALLMAGSRFASLGVAFAVQVAVGSLGGASALGVLQLFQSWTSVGGEVVARGLPTRALRETAVEHSRRDVAAILAAQRSALRLIRQCWLVLLVSVGLAILCSYVLGDGIAIGSLATLVAATLAAPLLALLRLSAETLKGMDAPLPAVLVESLLLPALLLLVVGLCALVGQTLSVFAILAAGLAGYLVAPLVLAWMVRRRLRQVEVPPEVIQRQPQPRGDLNILWATSLLNVAFLHLPFLVLPLFVETTEIGVYAVANKLIGSVTMLLLLLAAVFGPAFARAAVGAGNTLPGLLWRSQWVALSIFLPLAGILLAACEPLASVFNVPAGELRQFLLILGLGHLVNAATGLCGVMLNMAGAARLELYSTGVACIALVFSSPTVGNLYGIQGLAVLFSSAIAGKNLLSYLFAHYHLRHREAVA